ncbi:MAG: hypothetical protein KGN84_05165 [Acidobacteriota bacterium]|nr:hypothetical protein [Acidobacteriota bacterium]
MTAIECRQRALLALIKQRPLGIVNDPWLDRVASSRELRMLREIALWWRRFQIESRCRYTSRLLKRLECFDRAVAAYFESHATSPFIENLADGFLEALANDPDPVVSAVARFERAALHPQSPAPAIEWDRDPIAIFRFIEGYGPLPEVLDCAKQSRSTEVAMGEPRANRAFER